MRSLCPCKGCGDRDIGCHGWCERYISWRKKADEANLARNEYNVEHSITYERAFRKKMLATKRGR